MQTEKLAGLGRVVAGVAHEMNNPLGVILGYVKMASRRAPTELQSDLRVIEAEANQLHEIVNSMLALSRHPRLTPSEVDLRALIGELTERLREAGTLPGHVEVSGEATVEADSSKVRQILLNLLTNAAQVSGASGKIAVNIVREGREVRVVVRDSGPGVAPEARERLFEPFFTTKAEGTGLGLAVSRALAHAHGGSLELLAETRSGAAFELRLPLTPAGGIS